MATNVTEQHSALFKIMSILLAYPHEDLLSSMSELDSAVGFLQESTGKSACASFLCYLKSRPLLRLQEEYTSTFDLNPPTSLNLTFHTLGDTRERGNALAELIQVYRNAGYETPTDELPDYLPIILEFLSVCSAEPAERLLMKFEDSLHHVADRLRGMESPYAELLEALSACTGNCAGTGD